MSARSPLALFAAAAASVALSGPPAASAQTTVCDTDPAAVPFEPTVDPDGLNALLARLGQLDVGTNPVNVTLPGVCVDHRLPVGLGPLGIPLGDAPFTVTPALGSIRVDLELQGPFLVGVDGDAYEAVNCDSACVVELPYVGEAFNGCSIEAGIVGPLLSVFNASASWDDIQVTQTADTCVLGDCRAVHPLASTQASLTGFDVDATGFGSCNVCIDLPDPLPDPPCLNPCAGLDPLIEDLLQPEIEAVVADAFVNRQNEGVLIKVFSRQIVKDFGCIDIPEVRECRGTPEVAGLVRAPRDHGLNAVLYSLPLGVAAVLALRLRRRTSKPAPPA
jgi:hypothetical protein